MRPEKKQLLEILMNAFDETFTEISARVGESPTLGVGAGETTGSGEMYAAMFRIAEPTLKMTASVIVDVPVLTDTYFKRYAEQRGAEHDDEIELFCEFVDELLATALAKAGLIVVHLPPCQVIGGENFRTVQSNKSAIISRSHCYEISGGRLFINMAIHA